MDSKEPIVKELLNVTPKPGTLRWIGLRPAREADLESVDEVAVAAPHGLEGDHFKGRDTSRRQVTLIQAEHLAAVAEFLGRDEVSPALVRRNLVVSGINLYALRNRTFRIGDVVLEGTGLCHPCSRMEQVLGSGGYNAMRGHGGITARVIKDGKIHVGDQIQVEDSM